MHCNSWSHCLKSGYRPCGPVPLLNHLPCVPLRWPKVIEATCHSICWAKTGGDPNSRDSHLIRETAQWLVMSGWFPQPYTTIPKHSRDLHAALKDPAPAREFQIPPADEEAFLGHGGSDGQRAKGKTLSKCSKQIKNIHQLITSMFLNILNGLNRVDLLALPCAKLINRVGRSWKFPRKSVCWATAKKTSSLRKWLDESVVVARMSHSHAEDLATRYSVRIFRASTDPPQRYTPSLHSNLRGPVWL